MTITYIKVIKLSTLKNEPNSRVQTKMKKNIIHISLTFLLSQSIIKTIFIIDHKIN